MIEEGEYIEGWREFEMRAGHSFSQGQRLAMREAGIIFERLVGRVPDRRLKIYTYWSLYLRFLMKTGGKFSLASSGTGKSDGPK